METTASKMKAIYPMVITLKNTRKWKPENGNQKMETTASKMEAIYPMVITLKNTRKGNKKMETRKCKPLRVKWKLSSKWSLH